MSHGWPSSRLGNGALNRRIMSAWSAAKSLALLHFGEGRKLPERNDVVLGFPRDQSRGRPRVNRSTGSKPF
eukprot:11148923-Alexandrium_andersonii.AAC.1